MNPIIPAVNPFIFERPSFTLSRAAEAAPADTVHPFNRLLLSFVENVNASHQKDDEYTKQFLTGQVASTHQPSINSAKSEVMLHMISQISSKLSSATTTLLQMQV